MIIKYKDSELRFSVFETDKNITIQYYSLIIHNLFIYDVNYVILNYVNRKSICGYDVDFEEIVDLPGLQYIEVIDKEEDDPYNINIPELREAYNDYSFGNVHRNFILFLYKEVSSDVLSIEDFNKLKEVTTTETCSICLEEIEKGTELPCNHCFHKECIKNWLCKKKNECPLCKGKINI